jgi:hypothetical protein
VSAGWDLLTPHQQDAARAAARLIEDQGMTFTMLLFGQDKQGAIIANIEPHDAVRLIEIALKAAKSIVEVTEISTEERLH